MVDCAVIVSGGLDSVTLLYHLVKELGRKPAVISFLYGQKHVREIVCATSNAAALGCPHQICDLSAMRDLFTASALVSESIDVPTIATVRGDPQPLTYVPNRNMIFLSLAAAYAESQGVTEVFYGAQKHDMYGYWDCTPDFLNAINATLSLNRKQPIRIQAPFVNDSKADIVRRGLSMGVDYAQTWSCYNGRGAACGQCPTCAERLAAFAEIGVSDPLPYE